MATIDVYVKNTVETKETNEKILEWYEKENTRREDLERVNKVMIGLLAGQMVLYLLAFLKHLDDRDDEIDHIIDFNDYLQSRKHGIDLEMTREKVKVMNLAIPEVYYCDDVTVHREYTKGDARAIDNLSEQIARGGANGVPDGWGLYEGQLLGAKTTADTGGFIVNASKREREWMQMQKTNLMISTQRNIKSPFSASGIMNGHVQAMNIYSGLADMYASGFNSAGAGLGVLLGRMTASPVTGTQAETGGNV